MTAPPPSSCPSQPRAACFTAYRILASFFGGSVWQLEPETGELSEPERVARVKALEAWAGMSSDEMMARAERKELPPEPEYAEWLVLVHRSELL